VAPPIRTGHIAPTEDWVDEEAIVLGASQNVDAPPVGTQTQDDPYHTPLQAERPPRPIRPREQWTYDADHVHVNRRVRGKAAPRRRGAGPSLG
jgi:hypothetical protein